MNGSIGRILNILEALSSVDADDGFTTAEILSLLDMPASTVYRLLSELEKSGYLYRGHNKRLHPNFSFQRHISHGSIRPEELSEACLRVSNALYSASEIIQLRDQNLVWHLREEHPQQAIKLRAHPGFVRTSYELDSVARLALASLPIEKIEKDWDTAGFYDVGVAGAKVTWLLAREKINAVNSAEMQFDLQGNSKGVRRFCVLVDDKSGGDPCLLTLAEAAVPMRNEHSHVERIQNVLIDVRDWLLSQSREHEEVQEIKKTTR